MATQELNAIIRVIDQVTWPIKKVGSSLQGFAENTKQSFKSVEGDIITVWATAWIAFAGIGWLVNKSVEESNKFENAITWLRSIVVGTWWDFNKANNFIQEFTSDWLIWVADAATSLKNLLSRGFGLNEATQIMMRFKDSAAFGRQASLWMGDAIRGATEGLKNENSILVDNAGVTKNVSKMWEEYADTLWKSVNDLTLVEKRQAELNGIMEETKFQMGDAVKLTDSYAWQQAKLSAQTAQMYKSLWEWLKPVLEPIMSVISEIVEKITHFATENPKLTWTVLVLTWAITWIIAAASWLVLLLPTLATWIGLLGWAITFLSWPIGIVILALWALFLAWKNNFWWIQEKTKAVIDFISPYISEWIVNIKQVVTTTLDAIKIFWGKWWDEIILIVNALVSVVWTIFTTAFENLFIVFNSWLEILNQAVGAFSNLLSGDFEAARENIKNIFSTFGNTVVEIFTNTLNSMWRILDEITWWMVSKVVGAISKIKSLFSSVSWQSVDIAVNAWQVSWQRALWWTILAGNTYLVWENWPELVTPLSTSIVNNDVSTSVSEKRLYNPTTSNNLANNDTNTFNQQKVYNSKTSNSTVNSQAWWSMTVNINMGWVVVKNEGDMEMLVEKVKRAFINEAKLYNYGIT